MNSMNPTLWFKRLLNSTGGYFLLIVVALAQFATYIITIPVSLLIWVSAEFTAGEFRQLWGVTVIGMLLALAILLTYIFLANRQAFSRLQSLIKRGTDSSDEPREAMAWKQITSLPWQFAKAATILTILVAFLPMLVYESLVMKLAMDNVIYTAIGVLISSLSIVTLGMTTLERMIEPARQILLPKNFQAQLAGISSLRLLPKLSLVILTLIAIGILLVAPLGYHFTYLALHEPTRPNILFDYQIQSIGFSLFALLLGAGLAWLLSRSVSAPLNNLVEIFRKVESGDLTQRSGSIATDETGELQIYFNQMIARLESLQTLLEKQVAERTAQLEAVTEVGRSVSAILDANELIEKVVNLITERFGHYYAALFLVDSSGKWAELRSATGEAGRVLREARHRLEVGGKSMVGSAIALKQPRIALDVGAEPVRFDNPLLPYTHSEIALPLIVGEHVLGALDVQSTKQSAFSAQDVQTLQNMANQVAIALENARLFQETLARLQEVQTVQRQYLREAWDFEARREDLTYGVGDEIASEHGASLDVPLTLRDQVIGQISLTGDSEWPPEERAWVEAVATQAAVALENARLMETSRMQAGLERTVAEITTKIWSANTLEGILHTAAKEIGRALNASEATIELQMENEGAS